MRIFIAAVVAASVHLWPEVLAEPILPPGKPAGVKQAMAKPERVEMYIIAGVFIASASAAIAIVAPKSSTAPTSTSP
jgi:hypothetical protein